MGKKQSRSGSPKALLAAVVVMGAAVGGGMWFANKNAPPRKEPAATGPEASVPPSAVARRQNVKVYVARKAGDDVKLFPEERAIPSGGDPHRGAIERLLATNHEAGSSQYLIPLGTKLLGMKVNDGIAYADFSHELRDNFEGGSTGEALLVNAIVHTLTQFEDVKKVQILIEGKTVESIGGHLDISQPIQGDSLMVGQGAKE
jgi:spore germination protein GerM